MQRRLARPTAALALLATLGAVATLFAFSGYSSTAIQQQRDEPGAVATFDVTEATLSAATSGCGLCQQTGLCDHAFKGTPGQFCLTLVSGLPCCCPQDAQCVVSNSYNCRCRRVTSNQQPHYSSTTTTTTTTGSIRPMQLFPLFAMLLCVLCCVCAARDRNRPETDYPANQNVYVTPQYGATQDTRPGYQYGYPSAPSAPPASPYGTQVYDPYAPYAAPVRAASPHNHSSGNAFTAGAFGAVAGLAGGMLAGSMFGGGGSRPETTTTTTTTSYFGGDSGYTFGGDTGGGGGGDDGGDFGGDS